MKNLYKVENNKETGIALNKLAREQMIYKLLSYKVEKERCNCEIIYKTK